MTQKRNDNRREFAIRANIFTLRLARNWYRIFVVLLAIFVSLPFVAPLMMEAGLTGPAGVIYTMYSPFCHQFAFRSFFIGGDQIAYPRANAGSDLKPFEEYARGLPQFAHVDLDDFQVDLILAARSFRGNNQMGYKVTLCERDILIYLALLTGALIYGIPVVRRRLRPVPIYIYVILGLGPIGLDGFSQLFGYPPFDLWPARETLPIFRVVTGLLFGLMNAWLAFPYLEAAMLETRQEIEAKLHRAGIHI